MAYVFWFLFGALSGITIFITTICCIAGGNYSRQEEEELRKKHDRKL